MPQCQSWGSNTKKHRVAHWTNLRSISNWHFFTVSWHGYVHALLVARHELCRTYSVPARPVHDRRHGEAMRFWKSCKIQVFSPDYMLVPGRICDSQQAFMCHVYGWENTENVKLIDDTREMRAIISWDILTNWSSLLVKGQNLLLQFIRWIRAMSKRILQKRLLEHPYHPISLINFRRTNHERKLLCRFSRIYLLQASWFSMTKKKKTMRNPFTTFYF